MFDWKNYLEDYTGHLKIHKALYIANSNKESDKELSIEAFKHAVQLAKSSGTHYIYQQIYAVVVEAFENQDVLTGQYAYDDAWVTAQAEDFHKKVSKKESEINQAKNSQIKDSIRLGYLELGDLYYSVGELQNSLKNYIRAKDFCSVPEHTFEMCMKVVKVALELKNYTHVFNYLSKAASQFIENLDANKRAVLAIANTLIQLENHNYKQAMNFLLEVPVEFISAKYSSDFVLPIDVGRYGAILALSVFSRTELRTKIIQNPLFNNFFELDSDLGGMVEDFYQSQYKSCLSRLEKITNVLRHDCLFGPHIENLHNNVTRKALTQYFSTYKAVRLEQMAEAFNTDVAGIEKKLADLIADRQIEARIDSHNKIAYAKSANQKNNTYVNAIETGKNFVRDTEILLLRVNMLKQNFVYKRRNARMFEEMGMEDMDEEHLMRMLGKRGMGMGMMADMMEMMAGDHSGGRMTRQMRGRMGGYEEDYM